MKTIKCDICGRDEDDLRRCGYYSRSIYRYKVAFGSNIKPERFDICSFCLDTIKRESLKLGNESKEGDINE